MTQTITERLHIVEGSDWKDAIIALLEPESPYRPWRHGFGEAHAGDPVAVLLNTDPVSVLTRLAYVDDDGDPGCAVVDSPSRAGLVDLTTLAMVLGLQHFLTDVWKLEGDAAIKMELALNECICRDSPRDRFGHSSLAAARTLLKSGGGCDGCNSDIDLTGPGARDNVHIRTVDPHRRPDPTPPIVTRTDDSQSLSSIRYRPSLRVQATDWPAVLCRECHERMRAGEYRSFLDFRFEQHPACPQCGAGRTRSTFYGMPSAPWNIPPWLNAAGCCVSDESWYCDACHHKW
ncbi:hypothetical protein [Mycobacterium sp. 3519A]|uniref:hypothetical protein n=1 Tax=Mycobacterium sp. 3519A TaxID=2057184 RepID=UPI000C7C5619|nr:hypothetical protein [Mycobacterium sp. 3519A]